MIKIKTTFCLNSFNGNNISILSILKIENNYYKNKYFYYNLKLNTDIFKNFCIKKCLHTNFKGFFYIIHEQIKKYFYQQNNNLTMKYTFNFIIKVLQ